MSFLWSSRRRWTTCFNLILCTSEVVQRLLAFHLVLGSLNHKSQWSYLCDSERPIVGVISCYRNAYSYVLFKFERTKTMFILLYIAIIELPFLDKKFKMVTLVLSVSFYKILLFEYFSVKISVNLEFSLYQYLMKPLKKSCFGVFHFFISFLIDLFI